jgi:hypothetical protein
MELSNGYGRKRKKGRLRIIGEDTKGDKKEILQRNNKIIGENRQWRNIYIYIYIYM